MENTDLVEQHAKYIATMSSISHTYGNLLATAQKWILDLPIFPDGFFKTIHVQSRIAHEQIMRSTNNLTRTFSKKSKPIIIFRPRISYTDDPFLQHTLMTERMGGGFSNTSNPGVIELHPFLFDQTTRMNLQFSETRRTMYLDVIIILDTLMQQLNIMEALLNEFNKDCPFDIVTWLEAYLSPEYMEWVGNLAGVPVHDESGSVKEFLDYMNGHSFYPVTYKLAGATGREEFYRYYNTKIMATITDLDKSDGESVGQIMSNYQITFTLKMDFWCPGTNYLFSPNINKTTKIPVNTDGTLIPLFADIFDFDDLDLRPGWRVYQHACCQLDKPKDDYCFGKIIDQSVQEILNYHLKNGIPLINFIDIRVRKQGELIHEGYDYAINWEERKILFNNNDYGWYTYTIVIVIDLEYINMMVKKLFDLK